MPILGDVWFHPARGSVDDPWTEGDGQADAFVRTSRRVVERYSEGLRLEKVPHRISEVRMFAHTQDRDGVDIRVPVDPESEGFESSSASLPPGTADLTPTRRALLVLDVVDAAMRRLAAARGWSAEALDRSRSYALAHGLHFDWTGPWKWAPGRRHAVRPCWRIEDDGFGRLRFDIKERGADEPTGRFDEQWTGDTSWFSFRRRAKDLRWTGQRSFELSGHWDYTTDDVHVFRHHLDDALPLLDAQVPRPLPSDASSGIPVRVHGWGATAEEMAPRIAGPLIALDIDRAPDPYIGAVHVLEAVINSTHATWWAGSGRKLLWLFVDVVHGQTEGWTVTDRRRGEVTARLRRLPGSVSDLDPVATARDDVQQLLHRVAARLAMPEPPALIPVAELRRRVTERAGVDG